LFSSAPLTYEADDGVKATGLLTRLTIIPLLFSYRPYQRISAQLACAKHAYFYSYDWRAYPQDNAYALGALVERVITETGKQPSIATHSMGGLVTHGYLKTQASRASHVNKIIYISVPFDPGINYFDDVNHGAPVGLNKDILSPQALITHPGSFLLLPHHGSEKYGGIELMDPDVWQEQRYGAFRDGDADLANLHKIIAKLRTYHDILDTPKTITNPVRIIIGECYPTVHLVDSKGARQYHPGDGRVAKASAYPKDDLTNLSEASYCVKHDSQLDHKEIVEEVFRYLNAG
jgi:pimeloyl-ACP methyl ester carboxylesterase